VPSLMHIERADTLKDRLHLTSQIERRTVLPQGLPEQTSLMVALQAAVRGSGEDSHAKLAG